MLITIKLTSAKQFEDIDKAHTLNLKLLTQKAFRLIFVNLTSKIKTQNKHNKII